MPSTKKLETYTEFLTRIGEFERPELGISTHEGLFETSESVFEKVNHENGFRHFYGDTVVFELDRKYKSEISKLIGFLYQEAPGCFAQRLPSHSLHMTLHDLSSCSDYRSIKEEMGHNSSTLKGLLREYPIVPDIIHMRANCIVNMVNTSLVLALCPRDEGEYEKIMKLYCLVDEVKELTYKFTPHITLAYYSRLAIDENQIGMLKNVVRELNQDKWGGNFEVVLRTSDLVYQFFNSMNSYLNVFHLLH